jgi:hypothetical protein
MIEAQREAKRQQNRRWYAKNRERRRPVMRRYTQAWSLKRRYGLSPEDYATLLKAQGGRCALCRRRVKLALDHDHRFGSGNREAVRGLLCRRCNSETFRLFEKHGLANFWLLVPEYEPLGLSLNKAAHLAAYLRIPYSGTIRSPIGLGKGNPQVYLMSGTRDRPRNGYAGGPFTALLWRFYR